MSASLYEQLGGAAAVDIFYRKGLAGGTRNDVLGL